MGDARAFSLLELIAALSLLSVLGAVAVLSHQAMRPGLDLNAAARQIVMDLKVARMRAVARNTNERIVFTAASDTYQTQQKAGDTYTNDGVATALPRGIVVVECTARDAAISFRPRGTAGNFGTVSMRNSRGDVRQVVVDIAGQVRLQ